MRTLLPGCVLFCFVFGCLAAAPAPAPVSFEEMLAKEKQKFLAAADAWRNAKDPKEKAVLWQKARELGDGLRLEAGMEAVRPEEAVIEEVALGAPKAEKEIKSAATTAIVPLSILKTFENTDQKLDVKVYRKTGGPALDWVARRIGADCFELWTSREGWLFDRQGKELNHAAVPRRDGSGLQWFGAFHPDGSWITTDLWSRDDTLYLFSREGKYLKEIATRDMFPHPDNPSLATCGLIGWARSDAEGKGWIVGVPNESDVRVGEDFKPRLLNGNEPWMLCYKRQLGARFGRAVSDDGTLEFKGGTGGHGPGVGHFRYEVFTIDQKSNLNQLWAHSFWWNNIEAGPSVWGQNLGFWPGLHAVFTEVGHRETWFFNANGDAQGWIPARRIGDAADGKSMLFRDAHNAILTMSPELKITAVRIFADPSGAPVKPMMIFDDLRLGLFENGEKLILAAW